MEGKKRVKGKVDELEKEKENNKELIEIMKEIEILLIDN